MIACLPPPPRIAPPERSPERDALLRASLPHVPRLGWSMAALRAGAASAGQPPEIVESLFPAGAPGALEAWCDLVDREMTETADLSGLRTPQRVRTLIATRLRLARPDKEAVRLALAQQALPWNARLAARTLARTVSAIWEAAGDRSDDLSWYTRRATLAGLYGSVLAYWMGDPSEDDAATLAFLDRQLARLAQLQKPRPRWGRVA